MVSAQPAPLMSAFIDAVDQAVREQSPHHGRSAMPRAWLACCVTAVLVTNSLCWARFARASLGTSSLAALSWMFRHRKISWDALLVASVRVILRHDGLTCGSLVSDDRDNQRSKAAKPLAYLYTRRAQESGGYVWGQSLVFLLVVTPDIPLPVGFACYQPAPELSAWYKQETALKTQDVAPTPRPPKPSPTPSSPTPPDLALRLWAQVNAEHPPFRVPCITADALYGTAPVVDGAAALFGGVQVISPLRSHQKGRVHTRDQHVADSFATHPGTPQHIRIRGGEAVVALVGSARLSVCSHHPKRFSVAITDADEETYRSLMAADLTWRPRAMVQGHPRRWLVEVFVQDWKAPEGWSQVTKQPGEEGARRRVILSLRVDQGLCSPPDQHAQCKRHLPA